MALGTTKIVYFMRIGSNGPIKIGITGRPRKRLSGIRISSPEEIVILATTPGDAQLERALHERFASARIRGEWFKPTPDLIAYIGSLDPYVSPPPKSLRLLGRSSTLTQRLRCAVELRNWREEKGWSRKTAAAFLGVSPRTLESWEYGARVPPGIKLLDKLWCREPR